MTILLMLSNFLDETDAHGVLGHHLVVQKPIEVFDDWNARLYFPGNICQFSSQCRWKLVNKW